MPTVYETNLHARIGIARLAFAKGVTTDGRPYPFRQQKADEAELNVAPADRDVYVAAARWGYENGHIEQREFEAVQSVLTSGLILDTGWHVSADLATKVVVTKLCNELLTLRGDA